MVARQSDEYMNIQGSTLHTIVLRDGRSVRCHTDQLRSRVEKENATGHGARSDDDFEIFS